MDPPQHRLSHLRMTQILVCTSVGTSVLGLTANSTLMLEIDNTNTLDPQMSTPATFNARLIGGGTF